MRLTRPFLLFALLAAPLWGSAAATAADSAEIDAVVKKLNQHPTVVGTDESKSYRILFDAFLELSPPPMKVDEERFNLGTIHPGMKDWASVASWAESNPHMATAIKECATRAIIGLPYGRDNVSAAYREAGIMVDVGVKGTLRDIRFPYLRAVDTIAAWTTAEIYRLMESGQVDAGGELALAHLTVLRQFCDRDFLEEKWYFIRVLSDALENMRDMFFVYVDKITTEQFFNLAWWDIPFLRPDRSRLLMPEADRVVSEALIDEVFDAGSGAPDGEKFARTFAAIQSKDTPLTRFGAARRWKMISTIHGSLDASQERLGLVYDDWWRRWRVQEYDAILEIPSQFERTNRVRYAAVLFSMRDIQDLFLLRNQLIVEVNGTAMAAGICAYQQEFGVYPDQVTKISQFVRRSTDTDPYDFQFGRFKFLKVENREPVDTTHGRFWIEPDNVMLYSVGQNHEDERPEPMEHTDDGFSGNILIWPPPKVLQRRAGLID